MTIFAQQSIDSIDTACPVHFNVTRGPWRMRCIAENGRLQSTDSTRNGFQVCRPMLKMHLRSIHIGLVFSLLGNIGC